MLDRSLYQSHEQYPELVAGHFARAVADVFVLLRPFMSFEETGGVLISRIDGREHVTLVGGFLKYAPESCYRIAREKLARTFAMRRRHGHVSAWQSHNPGLVKYAGAFVIADDFGVSFSGLSEHWDEVILAIAAWLCGFIGLSEMEMLLAISKNPHVQKSIDKVAQEA